MRHARINRNARLRQMCYGHAPNGSAAADRTRQLLSRAYTTTLLR